MIPALPTRHAGVLFRSRLEARWAVFFDHLGIRWEYEPQGFLLSSGEGYLPDFWLPERGWYVEVKPRGGDTSKAVALAGAGHHVLLCIGTPSSEPLELLGSTEYGDGAHDYVTLLPGGGTCWAWCGHPDGARLDNANEDAVSAALSARFGT